MDTAKRKEELIEIIKKAKRLSVVMVYDEGNGDTGSICSQMPGEIVTSDDKLAALHIGMVMQQLCLKKIMP